MNSKEAARRAGIYAPDSRFRGNDEGDGVGKGGGKGDGEGNGKPDSRLSGMTWKWNARRLNLFGYIPRHLRRTIRKYCLAEDTPPLGQGVSFENAPEMEYADIGMNGARRPGASRTRFVRQVFRIPACAGMTDRSG